MKHQLSGRRLGAAVALTSVAFVGSLAMGSAAFAGPASATHAKPAAAVSTPASHPESQVKPDDATGCIDTLESFGYAATTLRIWICGTTQVSAQLIGAARAIAACTASMGATGVYPPLALAACTVAAVSD